MLRSVLQNSTLGFYFFASDSATPTIGKSGLTFSTAGQVKLSKNGAARQDVSPTINEIGDGVYFLIPIAAHRDTLGEMVWQLSATGAIIAPKLEKVVAVNDQTAAFGANTVAPANSTISSIYSVVQLTDSDVASIKTTVQGLVSAIWSNATRTLSTFSDSSGITTLLSRITGLLRTKSEDVTADQAFSDALTNGVTLADGAISAGKIASNAITASKIAPDAFTANKFADGSLNGKGDWSTTSGGGTGTNGAGSEKITFIATDGTRNIRNVKFGVTGSDTFDFTDVNGIAELNVEPDGTYLVYVIPPAEYESVDDLSIVVTTSGVSQTVTLTPVFRATVPAPDGLCNIEFDVHSQSGSEAQVTVSYELVNSFRIKDGNVNVNTDGLATPTNGRVSLTLIQGLVYLLKIHKGNEKIAEFKVSVPRETYHLLTKDIVV